MTIATGFASAFVQIDPAFAVANPGYSLEFSPGIQNQPAPGAPPPAPMTSGETLGAPCDNAGGCSAGNPINVGVGNKFEAVSDYETAGQNKLSFSRFYNSEGVSNNPGTSAASLGVNWRSTYDRYLHLSPTSGPATSVVAERADGQVLNFVSNSGTWGSNSDVDLKLVQTNSSTWSLTDRDDTIETYTVNAAGEGLLTSIQKRNGYKQTLNYTTNNQLGSITDSYNRTLSLTYANKHLQMVTTPDDLILTFGYTSSGLSPGVPDQLSTISYSTSPATSQSYVYENTALPFALTGIIDEDGNRYATWSYDSYGRALTSQHGGGADLTSVSYDDTNGNRTVTNALGQQEVYKFATLQGVPKVTEIDRLATSTTAAATRKFTYDSNGFLASTTDWNGNLTTYVNDSRGEPTTINEAVGTPQARTTSISYLSNYHLPTQIATPGLTTTFTYNLSGNVLTQTLTDTTATIVPYVTKGTARTWTYTWSNFLLASAKGPRTDVAELTSFTYDSTGALTKTTNALNQTKQITSHLPGGLPQVIVDRNGVTTTLAYDARQRLLTSTLSTAAGPLMTSYSYDAAGNLLKTTLPDGSALSNTYDAAHRLIAVTDLFNQSTSYTLDAFGDRTQTELLNNVGNVQRQHSATFDALGRILKDIGGVGQTTSFAYDSNGNALTMTDPLSHVTQPAFDALNHTIRTIDAGNGITKATYDPHDRPLTVVDPNSGSTTYVYDAFGDVIQRISPDTGKTVYTYDLAGNLTQSVDATGATANNTYDALDRVLTTKYPADSAENVAYSYDQSGHGLGIGRLTSVTDAVGSLDRSYDERGNILTEQRVHGTVMLLTSYTYDKASRVSSIVYPSGWSALYMRDIMGRITAINAKSPSGASQSAVSGVSYQPYGPVSALTYGNGVAETDSFDLDYRLTNLSGAGHAPLQKLTYGYDADNNVSSISDGVTAANSQSFGYDVLNRLTSATGSYGNLGYSYTAIGNRLTQTSGGVTTTYTYAPHSNQLTSIKTGTITQTVGNTAAGSVNSFSPAFGQVTSLTYNQAGRLDATSGSAGQITQYTFDAFGQRLVKVGTATATSLFQYDGSGHLLQEADGTGSARVDYIYLGDRPIATIQPSNNQIYFLHDDRLGTPQMATNSAQGLAWTTTYQPFGQISNPPTLIVQDLRFPGQENDLETGLYHNGFRDYSPVLGRYTESDPIGIRGGANIYAYARGNPQSYTDRRGLQAEAEPDAEPIYTELPSGPYETWTGTIEPHIRLQEETESQWLDEVEREEHEMELINRLFADPLLNNKVEYPACYTRTKPGEPLPDRPSLYDLFPNLPVTTARPFGTLRPGP